MNKNLQLWQGSMVSQEDFDRIMETQAAWDRGDISESELYDVWDDMRDKYPLTADTMFMDYLLIDEPSEIFYLGTDRGNNKTIKQLWNEFLNNPDDIYDIMNLGDSSNREQLFNAFENILGIDYNDSYELWLHNKRTPSMRVLDSVRVKNERGRVSDSMSKSDRGWDLLVEEVYHWTCVAADDSITIALNNGDIDEAAELVAYQISNYNGIESYGYDDTTKGWDDFCDAVRYIIVESRNKGWEYFGK